MWDIFKSFLMAVIIGVFIMRPSLSYADWQHDHGSSHSSGASHNSGHGHDAGRGHGGGHSFIGVNFSVWPNSYYYGDPYYPYYPYPADEGVLVAAPPVDEPVETIAPPPVTIDQPTVTVDNQLLPQDSFTVNIPNNKGGYTAVTLKKSGNGYIGPQGEFYTEFPKVAQLEVMYGK